MKSYMGTRKKKKEKGKRKGGPQFKHGRNSAHRPSGFRVHEKMEVVGFEGDMAGWMSIPY